MTAYRSLYQILGVAALATPEEIEAALSFIGIGEDTQPLIDGKPVSEYPDLYLYGAESRT